MRRPVVLVLALVAASLIAPARAEAAGRGDEAVTADAIHLFLSVAGTYQPIVGAFDCDEGSDEPDGSHNFEEAGVLWYAPGSAADYLWTDLEASGSVLTKTQVQLNITRTYVPLVGDYDGDRCDDILWYGVGTASDVLWWGGPNGFTTGIPIAVNGTYRPVSGFFGGAAPGIFWYAPDGTETVWRGTKNRANPFVSVLARPVSGKDYQPVSFYDPWNGLPEILWYAPGSGADSIWAFDFAGAVTATMSTSIQLTYRTAGCGSHVLLHGPGSQPDTSLSTAFSSEVRFESFAISGTYVVAGSGNTTLGCTVVWHGPGTAPDQIWLPNFPTS